MALWLRQAPRPKFRSRPGNLLPMAEVVPKEGASTRLAEIRGQLKLLADYL
jgi:hypothetical protein